MPLQPKTVKRVLEIAFHMFLVVAVPLIYLDVSIDFNKYRLEEHMTYVYVYWAVYIVVTVIFYGRKKRLKRYQPPKCTKKYQDL